MAKDKQAPPAEKKQTDKTPDPAATTQTPPSAPENTAPPAADQTVPSLAPDTQPPAEPAAADVAVVKSGFRKIRIPGFAGLYKDATFADDGTCDRVSETTLADLKSDFPGAEIEELI